MAVVSSIYFLTFIGEFKVVRTKMLVFPLNPLDDENSSTIVGISETETSNGTVHSATPTSLNVVEANNTITSTDNWKRGYTPE